MEEVDEQNPRLLDQGEQKEHNRTYNIFCWIFQIGVWVAVVATSILYIMNEKIKTYIYFIDIIVYIIYLILEFCSSTSSYLIHKKMINICMIKWVKYLKLLPI
ncbi:hypothetical protein LY90DRAFT_513311 [Neocallimastix californiae]|uniref:Uncharacterized protein n=1 Tax=Neocallimastix californiae TaxID=1754190 RepID=A0A1Y2AZ36_9FUNG|nr:hypothetical protein LY90DRAFT_513311 [Neocallimastix californiae]|eukprot:ORY27832.1 hypothetical protein LY90DRAFT_513311 [Neocallimastix californiae]